LNAGKKQPENLFQGYVLDELLFFEKIIKIISFF